MAETVEGGAFQSATGEWHDSEGRPLTAAQIKAAEKLADEQQAVTDAADVSMMKAEANRDPVARALTAVLQQQQAPTKSEK